MQNIKTAVSSSVAAICREFGLWFKLSVPLKRTYARKRERLIGLLSDCLLAFLFGVVPMPVILRWILWCGCWCALLGIVFLANPVARFPRRTKTAGFLVLLFLFIGICWPVARSQWKLEMSESTTGILVGPECDPFDLMNRIQIGDTSIIEWNPLFEVLPPQLTELESFLKISKKNNKYVVDSEVRDELGNLVISIKNNEWMVPKSGIWDKNYTTNSIEVMDAHGRVVLQITLLSDRVKVQGEWRDSDGNYTRLVQTPSGAEMGIKRPLGEVFKMPKICPIFLYPSSRHWGELAPKTE
jgi:hypothetical protein